MFDLVTIKRFATVKKAVFCNFDLAIFPVVSSPPPLPPRKEEYHKKDRVQRGCLYVQDQAAEED